MLKDKLQEMSAASAGKIPAETLAIMGQAKENLAASGILERTIKVGDKFPDFSLEGPDGKTVNLLDLRRQGPVLISIYRGVW